MNNKTLKRNFEFDIKQQDYVYEYTQIMHQMPLGNFTYTFSLSLPKVFYDINPEQHNNIFDNLEFLKNKDKINDFINNRIK